MKTCATCRFWRPDFTREEYHDHELGDCTRRAPFPSLVITLDGSSRYRAEDALFPRMTARRSCGDWEEK